MRCPFSACGLFLFRGMSLTRRFVEQRIQKNRHLEAKNHELRSMLVMNNILAGHGKSEARVEALRRSRSEAAERRDLFTDYTFVRSEQEKERRMMVAEAEERLADELARRNADQTRENMNKRRICDGSEELRALKERLHAAKVNKERAQQLFQKEVKKDKERQTEHIISEHMNNERLENIELEHKLEIEKMKQRERVKHINQQQIAMKEAQRQEALQEYLKEKDQVEELVNRINKEDSEELAAKHQKQMESKTMMLKFKEEQQARQKAAEEEEEAENRRIADFAREKAEREERLAREKEQADKEKERILLTMIGDQEERNRAAEELEQLRNDLHQEEHEAEMRRREELQVRKKFEDMEEMKRAYVQQMEMQERKKETAVAEEAKLREMLMKKFAEDDRIEQMNEHRRRMKVEAHKREANRLVELRREAFDAAREQERSDQQRLREEEADRQVIIEAERQRLLREHAAPLRDFLPKGTMEHPDRKSVV